MDALPGGSYLAVSHWGLEVAAVEGKEKLADLARTMSRQQYMARSREDVARFFSGLEIAEPGVVPVQDWWPVPGGPSPARIALALGAVGRKP